MRIVYLAFAELDIPNACRTHVMEVIHHMARLEHHVTAILPKPLTDVEFPERVTVRYITPWSFSWLGKLLFNLHAAYRMLGLFLWARPDAVYKREMSGNPLPTLLCRLFHLPLFIEINGLLIDVMKKSGHTAFRCAIERHLQQWKLQSAAGLIIPSDHVRKRLQDEYALPSGSCAFIYNGFNPQLFHPGDRQSARSKLNLPVDAFALVFVGLLWATYDLRSYIQIIQGLRNTFPKLVMWVVGDGPMRQPWEAEVQVLGLEDTVRFVGYQPEALAAEWIRAANLCLVPHTEKGLMEHGALSTKIWAYAGCARPILLHHDPRQDFPQELLPLFRVVPPEDPERIESEIIQAMTAPSRLDQEGRANASWVHAHATWSHTARRTIHFIQERMGTCVESQAL